MDDVDKKLETGLKSIYDRIRRPIKRCYLKLAVTQNVLQGPIWTANYPHRLNYWLNLGFFRYIFWFCPSYRGRYSISLASPR